MPAGTVDPAFYRNEFLARRLKRVIQGRAAPAGPDVPFAVSPGVPSGAVDIVVTPNEINDRHGTGPLIKRILRGRRGILCIRSKSDWGLHDFGDWNVCLPQTDIARPESFRRVLAALEGCDARSILCVPFLADELITSIALEAAFGAPLCAWIMDDQNIVSPIIADGLMREFLGRCCLRLATHPELRHAYEHKYGLPFHLLPAVVPDALIGEAPDDGVDAAPRAALLGSFWDRAWFDNACAALAGCGCQIDWFGNNQSPWVAFSREATDRAGIRALGLVPEAELAARLRGYPFVIVPAGALDGADANPGVAWLSLPGRILFAVAASKTPVLVLGSEKTCAARFVRHFGVGETAPYRRDALRAAMESLRQPDNRRRCRRHAAAIARQLSDSGVVEWLAHSIELGRPADDRFEDLFRGYDPSGAEEAFAR
ncbi:MAG: hypothetical protein KIT09_06890 [Bryobacteraceae bacterium]|nr:hypothetical protein [Bryobacteraceae bacterium]